MEYVHIEVFVLKQTNRWSALKYHNIQYTYMCVYIIIQELNLKTYILRFILNQTKKEGFTLLADITTVEPYTLCRATGTKKIILKMQNCA